MAEPTDPTGPIVVVSGLPRSGTSLMMQMLDAGGLCALTDGHRCADEDNPRGYYEFEAVKRTATDRSWLARAPGRAVKMVHVLLRELPTDRRYEVVFMVRALDEVVRSQRVMLDRLAAPGPAIDPERLEAVYQREYDAMRAWLDGAKHIRAVFVSFNDLIVQPSVVVDSVAAFLAPVLDSPLETRAMVGCVDPQLYRQRLV